MTRVLIVAIVCLSMGHALGHAQRASPYNIFADMRESLCSNWTDGDISYQANFDKEVFTRHAPEHAWVYGYVAGAGLIPPPDRSDPERVRAQDRLDVRGVDDWMGRYCRAHPYSSIAAGAAALVAELNARR